MKYVLATILLVLVPLLGWVFPYAAAPRIDVMVLGCERIEPNPSLWKTAVRDHMEYVITFRVVNHNGQKISHYGVYSKTADSICDDQWGFGRNRDLMPFEQTTRTVSYLVKKGRTFVVPNDFRAYASYERRISAKGARNRILAPLLGIGITRIKVSDIPRLRSQVSAQVLEIRVNRVDRGELDRYLESSLRYGMITPEQAEFHRQHVNGYWNVYMCVQYDNRSKTDISNATRLDPTSPVSRLVRLGDNFGNLKPFDRQSGLRFMIDASGHSTSDLQKIISESRVLAFWAEGFRDLDVEFGLWKVPDDRFIHNNGIVKAVIDTGGVPVIVE